jgi:SAM-dependent methyltransferase
VEARRLNPAETGAPDCRRRPDCRLCGSRRLTRVLALTPTPPANAFVSAAELNKSQPRFPLDVFFCEDCGHVQLLDVVDPRVLFENYVYVSGTSPVFVRHFEDYARAVLERFRPAARSLVLDIGSNDGTLLGFFRDGGMKVLGIDPARAIAAAANARGIETWTDFFTLGLAARIRTERGPAAVVAANNVFAHVDDLAGVAEGIAALLAPDGVFVFEVSYLVDVYEKTLFDTVYHEHLAYHSVAPLVRFFAAHGLELFAAERVDSHGGSLRGFAQLQGGPRLTDGSVAALVALEKSLGLDRAATLAAFGRKIDAARESLRGLLLGLKQTGKRIAGFGAPAKATTLMYHFGLGPDVIEFIADDSPLKQGLFTPGLHVPVLAPEAIDLRRPDYLLILAWNFARPIMAKHARFAAAGGRFIVPLPTVEVFP